MGPPGASAHGGPIEPLLDRPDPQSSGQPACNPETGGAGRRMCCLCNVAGSADARDPAHQCGRKADRFHFSSELRSIIGPDKVLAEQSIAVHELVAYLDFGAGSSACGRRAVSPFCPA